MPPRRRSSASSSTISNIKEEKPVPQFRMAAQKRKTIEKYHEKSSQLPLKRQQEFQHQQTKLLNRLESIKNGNDEEYLELLHDFQESRDEELVRLNLHRAYRLERFRKFYDADMGVIERQYENMVNSVNDKLLRGLESHIKRFREDKTLWDISSDNTTDLGMALGMPGITSASTARVPSTRRQAAARAKKLNSAGGVGTPGGGGGESGSGSESGFGMLLRPGQRLNGVMTPDGDITSFLSEVESEHGNQNGDTTNNESTRSRIRNQRNTKATKALTTLKPAEISEDLALLRK